MNENYKKSLIENYKKRKKIKNEINIDIEKVINIKQTLISAFKYLRNYKEFNEDFSNNIKNILINEKQITTIIQTIYFKKKIYKKYLYIDDRGNRGNRKKY